MNKKIKIKMVAATLLGLVLPFGALWGPYLISAKTEICRTFRKHLFWIELAAMLIVGGISAITSASALTKALLEAENKGTVSESFMYVFFSATIAPSISIILLAVGLIIYLYKSKED